MYYGLMDCSDFLRPFFPYDPPSDLQAQLFLCHLVNTSPFNNWSHILLIKFSDGYSEMT